MLVPKTARFVIALGLLTFAKPAPAQDNNEIRAWIQQMGSPRFAEREQAERRLAQSDRAVALIKLALVSDATPEVRRRCSRLLDQRRSGMRDDLVRELERMARRGEYARGTATAVAWRYDLREKLRDYHAAAAQSLAAAVEQKTGQPAEVPKLKNTRALVLENDTPTRCVFHTLFALRELELGHACTCSFLVTGSLRTNASLTSCVALVNGSVMLRNVNRSVVFVDGNLTLEDAEESLIVCTGTVESQAGFDNCTVVCGGAIKAPAENSPKSILRSKDKDLAALVRPWNAAELGVEPASREGRVYAGRVDPKSPMGAAGVEPSDLLLSLDGQTISTRDDALNLLRRKSTEFLPFAVRVKRGERELELIAPWTVPPAAR